MKRVVALAAILFLFVRRLALKKVYRRIIDIIRLKTRAVSACGQAGMGGVRVVYFP